MANHTGCHTKERGSGLMKTLGLLYFKGTFMFQEGGGDTGHCVSLLLGKQEACGKCISTPNGNQM